MSVSVREGKGKGGGGDGGGGGIMGPTSNYSIDTAETIVVKKGLLESSKS